MPEWTDESITSMSRAEVDYVFSDGSDYQFSDGTDYVFSEASTNAWSDESITT